MAAEAILLMSQHMWEVTQPYKFEFQIGKEQRQKSTIPFWSVGHTTLLPAFESYTVHLKQVIPRRTSTDVWFLPEST